MFDITREPFDKLVTAEDLFGEETEAWLFAHDIVEACTAVKGRALQHIMAQADTEKVFYFDPDTAVFNSMEPIVELLDDYSIVLTPHQITPEPAIDRQAIIDNEIGSLKWGVFNLGFIAVSNDTEAHRFSRWWADRLHDWCHDRTDIGVFVDQKWCNLVPCFFDRVKIIRDPGYNVASWNLSQRRLFFDAEGTLLVNGCPLRFFHFTKLGPTGDTMTRRYAKGNVEVYELWAAYRRCIDAETDPKIPKNYWFYGNYSDGTTISQYDRRMYRERADMRLAFPQPFNVDKGLNKWRSTRH